MPEAEVALIVPMVRGGMVYRPNVVTFGTVTTAAVGRATVAVYEPLDQAHRIARVETTVPTVTARFVPVEPAGRRADPLLGRLVGHLEVTADTSKPASLQGDVRVVLVGREGSPDHVGVVGKVAAPVEVFPAVVVLPRQSGAGPIYHATCLLQSRTGPLVTARVTEVPGHLRVQVAEDPPAPLARSLRIECAHSTAPPAGRYVVRVVATADGAEVPLAVEVSVSPP